MKSADENAPRRKYLARDRALDVARRATRADARDAHVRLRVQCLPMGGPHADGRRERPAARSPHEPPGRALLGDGGSRVMTLVLREPAGRRALDEVVGGGGLLAFDFDGTLAPIVRDPASAAPRASTRELLARLALAPPRAGVSGRARPGAVEG